MAVCDLLVSVTSALPRVITLSADGWVLGKWACYLGPYLEYYFPPVGMYLICCMTTCKLLMLCFPFLVRHLESNKVHCMCAAAWIGVLAIPVVTSIVEKSGVIFNYRTYACDWNYSQYAVWKWLTLVLSALFMFIPNILVVITTAGLLVLARRITRKGKSSMKWQGVMTTILTASVYVISILPHAVYNFTAAKVDPQNESFHKGFYRVGVSCLYLNTVSNFYIYCLTVPSFRQFLWMRVRILTGTPNTTGK